MEQRPVLIVEDDTLLTEALTLFFVSRKIPSMIARSVEEARSVMERTPPALILLDVLMPGSDGVALLREMRDRNDLTPVFVMTNLEKEDVRRACERLGVERYILKCNVSIRALGDAVQRVLERQRIERGV